MLDTIIEYLIRLFKIILGEIIKESILNFINLIIDEYKKNKKTFTESFFIESPCYNYNLKIKNKSLGNSNSLNKDHISGIIILGIIIEFIIVGFFKEYSKYISLFLKWFGIIPIIVSIIFCIFIYFNKKVQEITVKFIVVSAIVSILTLYY